MIHIEVPVVDTGNFRDDLLRMLRGAYHIEGPLVEQLVVKMLGEVKSNPKVFQYFMERRVTPRFQAIMQMIERAKARGEVRQDVDTALIMSLAAGPYFFQVLFGGMAPTPASSPNLPEQLVDAIMYGIASREAPGE